ncbi:MAG: alpha-L-fucosidase [Sedimentisphaerales bacterium]|nr:alpha-L-fucosidase [Sedimentisphaerales bacterium]
MCKRILSPLVVSMVLIHSVFGAASQDVPQDQRMAWFRQAKFGMFIHWGLYAIPAGYWKGQRVPGIGEWIMNRARIPVTEYEQLAKQFNPVKFDADQWVQLAQDAGMRYMVVTSKHHDGFALFDSKVSDFDVVDATPFKRDILKELSQACQRRRMPLGFYYSQAQDWHEPGGIGNTWDFGPDDQKVQSGAFDRYLREKAEPQIRELLTGYGPICLIWFDTPRYMTAERAQRFVDLVRSLQPACLIDGRLGIKGDYVSTGDNAIPNRIMEGDWETPATTNHTWGYRIDDQDWKSPGEIIFKLVDIVSKGGNYLLNVGPTAEGLIPEQCAANLRFVGKWLKVYGEAVCGAGPTPFGEEFGDYSTKLKDRQGNPVFLAFTDWRCTTRPGRLYFTIFRSPRDGFDLPAFKNPIKRAYLLSESGTEPVKIETVNEIRVARVPRNGPHATAYVLVVEIEGDKVER